jgi:phage major head subunit gpT-like protein
VAVPNPIPAGAGAGQQAMDVLVVPRLSNQPTVYYVAATDRGIKPIVLQVRKEPEFIARTSPEAENIFHRKEFEYGADARGNCGYGLPFTIIRAVTV